MDKQKQTSSSSKLPFVAFCIASLLFVGFLFSQFAAPKIFSVSYSTSSLAAATATTSAVIPEALVALLHVPTPEHVRAIYMSQCVVGTPGFRKQLIDFIDQTDLNAVVIDIKDYSGGISFPTSDPRLAPYVSKSCGASDMKNYIEELHRKNIYVIGRITVFQDPTYAKAHPELAVKTKSGGIWKNYGGLAFIDVGAKPFWDYIATLGKVSYEQEGFDELNFDYIRFPSDGPMVQADYTFDRGKSKSQALEEFFQYLHNQLKPTGVIMSADLFGYVTVHTDDLGIGQVLERAMPYFDYIDPMVYPSHYNSGFGGLKDVNSDPYRVIDLSMKGAVARALATSTNVFAFGETPVMKTEIVPASETAATTTREVESGLYKKPVFPASIIRPWLQSFDYPVTYTPAMVSAQIKAAADNGLQSWLFWDAGNKYRALRSVLSSTGTIH